MAKKYLDEIEKEEQSRAEDKEVHRNVVAQRLDTEYLDSVGKLRKKIADDYVVYSQDSITILKHKLHKLPVTCLCLSSDNTFMFSGSKTQFVLKWDLNSLKAVGSFDCTAVTNHATTSSDNKDKQKKKTRSQILAMALSSDFKFLVSKKIHPVSALVKHIHFF